MVACVHLAVQLAEMKPFKFKATRIYVFKIIVKRHAQASLKWWTQKFQAYSKRTRYAVMKARNKKKPRNLKGNKL